MKNTRKTKPIKKRATKRNKHLGHIPINSYYKLKIPKHGFLVFDIDDTVLRYDYRKSESYYVENLVPIDPSGFRRVCNIADKRQIPIIFLTARSEDGRDITTKQIHTIGVKNQYPIYFSNGSDKGEYLYNEVISKMNKIDKKMHVVFVDDLVENLDNMKNAMTKYNIRFTNYLAQFP